MKKSKVVQPSLGFHVETKQIEKNERHEETKRAEVIFTGKLGLNGDWKNFGDYIKNLRGNKQNKY